MTGNTPGDPTVPKGLMREFQDRPVLIRNVRLVDIENNATPGHTSDIRVEKGRFSLVAPSGELPSRGLHVVDGRNRFALPGLIDCHVHICGIFLTEVPGISDLIWIPGQIFLNHRAHLRSGVTLVRDMTAPLRVSLLFRSLSKDPCSGFPRVLCAGPMLTVPGGYPPYLPKDRFHHRWLAGPLRLEIRNDRDAIQWVDRLARAGVDWIKLGFQSAAFDLARTSIPKPSAGLFRTIVERAHHHHLPVAVHHYWLADLRELVDLPFDTLEHITEDGDIDDRTLDRMAERHLPVTTDLEQSAFWHEPETFLHRICQDAAPLLPKPRRHIQRLLRDVADGRDIYGLQPSRKLMELAFVKDLVFQKMRNLKRLSDHGIPIAAATDAGVHMSLGILPDELCRMSRAGVSPARVLRSATIDAAKLLRIDDAGRIRPGCRADMILYGRDPLLDIEAVRKPEFVMRDGVPILWQR
jgi:imidazolonepropionase-like amidohydrolase